MSRPTSVAVLLVAVVAVVLLGTALVRHFVTGGGVTFHTACASPAYPARPRPIIAFGDSITQGFSASQNCVDERVIDVLPQSRHIPHTRDTSYPAYLLRATRWPVLNFGVVDEETSQGVPRLRRVLRAYHPRAVVIEEGVDDVRQATPAAQIVANLRAMVRAVKSAHVRPVLVTVLPLDDSVKGAGEVGPLNVALRQMARAEGVRVVDAARVFSRDRSHWYRHGGGLRDGIHPNDVGYQQLSQMVAAALF